MDTRKNRRVSEMAKELAEKPVGKIKVESLNELLNHPIYLLKLTRKMDVVRPSKRDNSFLGIGLTYKRTPLDELEEMGALDDIDWMVYQFIHILNKTCKLSSAIRSAIDQICKEVYFEVENQFEIITNTK